jgi:hypothetical protein
VQESEVDGFAPETEGDPGWDAMCRSHTDSVGRAVQDDETEEQHPSLEHVGDLARVDNLGFGFEMFTLWATVTMARRWSNDCDEHVKGIVQGREHIFGTPEDVLSQMPKITTKYCAFSDISESANVSGRSRVSDDDVVHKPISVSLLRKSTHETSLPSILAFSDAEIKKVRNEYERFMQREVSDNAMYEELNHKLKLIGGIPGVRGNLWARSTWELAARNDLIARGQAHGGADDVDLFHVRDSDLDIRLRMVALVAKNNPDDLHIASTIGSRKNAGYGDASKPTVSDSQRAARDRRLIVNDEYRRLKRQRVGLMSSYDVTPMPCAALGNLLDPQPRRARQRDA